MKGYYHNGIIGKDTRRRIINGKEQENQNT